MTNETQIDWSGDSSKWLEEKKLGSLNAEFRKKVEHVLTALGSQGFQPRIVFGWRSVAVQLELYAQKATTVKFSFHNAQLPDGTPDALAADIIDKRWAWSPDAAKNGFWTALGTIAEGLGLVWGGRWKSFPDVAHVQSRQNGELASVKQQSGL